MRPGLCKLVMRLVLTLCVLAGHEAAAGADDRRALLIGISEYDEGCAPAVAQCVSNNLAGPANDVAALSRVLQSRYGFSPAQITILSDSMATKARVMEALESLAQWAGPGRSVFLYFSGHGTGPLNPRERLHLPDGSGALVLARPAEPTGDLIADQLLVGRTDLRPVLNRIDQAGAHVFAIFDACYSRDSVRSTRLQERRFRNPQTGEGVGFDDLRIDVTGLRERKADIANSWPYRNVVYYSASSANETAIDLSGYVLTQWPTIDGKAHGALTDAVLRVMDGKETFLDADGDGRMSYAELFASVERFMRQRQYPHTPHRQPFALSSSVDSEAVASWPVLGHRGAAQAVPVLEAGSPVRISVEGLGPTASRALGRIDGMQVVKDSPEFHVRQGADGRYLMTTAHGEAVWQDRHGVPVGLTLDQLLESLTLRSRLRALTTLARQRSAGMALDSAPGERDIGGTLRAGEPLSWAARSSVPAGVILLHVMGDGSARVWLPARNEDDACEDSVLQAGAVTILCHWGGAAPPFGLDALFLFAFEDGAPEVQGLGGGPFDASSLDSLERAISAHRGRVSAREHSLFTVYRP